MVRLQRLTGMRPQEVVELRSSDIDMRDPSCWAYRPYRHKGEHHEKDRTVFIGPKAQEVRGSSPLSSTGHKSLAEYNLSVPGSAFGC